MRAIGLMSGTSLDGIDAALVELRPRGAGFACELIRLVSQPFEDVLRTALVNALPPHVADPAACAHLDRALGVAFARAALAAASGTEIDYVASHGLTLFHDGAAHLTTQIGDPYLVRDAARASVVFDFRRADCARGGNGAPLAPYVDALLFGSAERDVVALNIGGIANVSIVPRGPDVGAVAGWDTGPGNMLLDAFVSARTNGAQTFDRDGTYAARGTVDRRALAELVAREMFFLVQPPPKSTGRERFGAQVLAAHADLFARLSLEDGCATLCAFTVATIADSLVLYGPARPLVVASGGGTRNPVLVAMLAERIAADGGTLGRSDDFGVDPAAKEAVAFAVLGYETLRGRPANVPRATGAASPAVLGAIAPFGLDALLVKMRAEASANGEPG
jgi:anhydro-N-acetylmuramic acid kinase